MKNAFKNKSLYIFFSIILSLFFHLFLLLLFMKVSFFPGILNSPPKKPSRRMKIIHRPLDLKKFEKDRSTVSKPDTPPEIPDDMETKVPGSDGTTKAGGNDGGYDIPQSDIPILDKDPKFPSIIAVDADLLPPERMEFNRNLIPKLIRSDDVDYSGPPPSKREGGIGDPTKMRVSLPPQKKVDSLPNTPDTRLIDEEPVVQMDPLIDVEIFKYPLPRGGGFFRVDLSTNKKATALRTFNKDVVFLVDISGSIGRRRLAEFKMGIKNALPNLKANDRMNIVAFKSNHLPLFSKPAHPSKANLKSADSFLFRMTHGGTTNIYSALAPYVGMENRIPSRPLIIFLLSDGQVNTGEVVGNRDLINAISNQNHDSAGIYSYSCGDDRNSFLMDLLSYRNRGESISIPDIKRSNPFLSKFINAVSDVKVADLEYQISSDLADAAFPKRLPNLYKGKTLSVYGRYEDDSDTIGLRVTGRDSTGIKREIVVGGYISDAKLATDSLAKKWAMQYIYHLYSLLSVKYDEKIKNRIHDVALRYRLDLPYLDSHLVPKRKNYIR